MATKINYEVKREALPTEISRVLPLRLTDEIARMRVGGKIEEVRLRRCRVASLNVSGRNVMLATVLSASEMDSVFAELCGRSVYAYGETISRGFVTLDGGIRVGICGRAVCECDKVSGVYDVSGINIRLPMPLLSVGEPICEVLDDLRGNGGVLIFSPPAEGKTTLLRAVAAKMAGGERALRVSVVDTRGELSYGLSGERLSLDVLSGYPRGVGIEIATRTMNAELIVCDEIGDEREAEAIIAAQNAGVPLLASAHGESLCGILRRRAVARLHRARVFGAYVGIKKHKGDFLYNVYTWEEADAVFEDLG